MPGSTSGLMLGDLSWSVRTSVSGIRPGIVPEAVRPCDLLCDFRTSDGRALIKVGM